MKAIHYVMAAVGALGAAATFLDSDPALAPIAHAVAGACAGLTVILGMVSPKVGK